MEKRQHGFSLMELVVVIVLLSVLAVTALPYLLGLQSDARTASLQGLKRGMQSASELTHTLAVLEGVDEQAKDSVTFAGKNVNVVYGYPAATSSGAWAKLIVATFEDGEWNGHKPADWYFHNPSSDYIRFMPRSRNNPRDNCYLEYFQATVTQSPRFEFVTHGC